MCDFCLPAGSNSGSAASKVDKNCGKCVIFVYLCWFKFRERGLESRQKLWKMCDFCLPDTSKMGCAVPKVDKNRGKCVIFVYRRLKNRDAQT